MTAITIQSGLTAYNFQAKIIHDKEINGFIGIVPSLPGAHSQVSTLNELYKNLEEVIHLCLEEMNDKEKAAILIS